MFFPCIVKFGQRLMAGFMPDLAQYVVSKDSESPLIVTMMDGLPVRTDLEWASLWTVNIPNIQ
jgi:hypothetical protein